MACTRVGQLVPEHYEHRSPGMGVVAAGVEVVEVYECQECGVLVSEHMVEAHNAWHDGPF